MVIEWFLVAQRLTSSRFMLVSGDWRIHGEHVSYSRSTEIISSTMHVAVGWSYHLCC